MKNFRHRINNYESAISPNLFDNIMAERKKKQDTSVGFWAITISVFALLAFATLQTSLKQESITPSSHEAPVAVNNTSTPKQLSESNTTIALIEQQSSTNQTTLSPNSTASIKKNSTKTTSTVAHSRRPKLANSIPQKINYSPIQKTNSAKTNSTAVPNRAFTSPSIPLPTMLPTALLSERPIINPFPNNDCYTFTGRNRNGNSKLFIDFLGSPDYVNSKLTPKSSENQNYKKSRAGTENYEFSYSGQFGIGLETGSGVVIRSGVNYSRYESRFRKSDPDFKKVSIEQIFDQQGNLIRTDTITTIGTLDIQHYNTHKYIGIPLTLGYTTSGRKLDIGVNVGAQFNIQTSSKGRFIGADLQTTDFTLFQNSNKPAYKTQIGIQGIANLTFAYEIGEHFDLILAPHVKFTPSSITTNDYPLTEKLITTGLWLGGRVRF